MAKPLGRFSRAVFGAFFLDFWGGFLGRFPVAVLLDKILSKFYNVYSKSKFFKKAWRYKWIKNMMLSLPPGKSVM